MSAAARKKLAAAQRARWAKWKKNKETSDGISRVYVLVFNPLRRFSGRGIYAVFTWYLHVINLLF